VSDTTELETDVTVDPVTGEIIDEKKLAQQLLAQAREQGVGLIGPGGLLSGLTKTVLETALEAASPSTWATSMARPRWGRTCATAPGPRRC
jgi:hypothetical protein